MEKSNFLNAKVKEFETKYWSWFIIKIKAQDLKRFKIDENWYFNFKMRKRKSVGKDWETHFIVEDDFKQKQNKKNDLDFIPDNWVRNDWLPF